MAPFSFLTPFFLVFILLNHPLLTTTIVTHFDDENGSTGGVANSPPPPPPQLRAAPFKPVTAAIVGILTAVFTITFLLLLYMQHCKRSTYANSSRNYSPSRRNSGIERRVIESLPMFRFSSLRGQKDSLECAVCLNKFDADEVLRLLPKCKHAFHFECIDTWLEAHSTCPLCRYRVDPEDVLLVQYNQTGKITPRSCDQEKGREYTNTGVSGRHSSAEERGHSMEIVSDFRGRISLDSWSFGRGTRNHESGGKSLDSWKSFRSETGKDAENPEWKSKLLRKDGQLPVTGDKRRVEHRIIISGCGEDEAAESDGRRRWSDVEAADLLYLKSEMMIGGKAEEGKSTGRGVINGRSASEITGRSRYRSKKEKEEERVAKRWLAWVSQSQRQQDIPAARSSSSTLV